MKRILISLFCIIRLLYATLLPALNGDTPDLMPLPKLYIDVCSQNIMIICPERDDYQPIAHSLAEGMKKHTGYSPAILSDNVAP